MASVSSPSIEFECGGHVVHSTVIKNTQKNPNFDQPLFFFDVVGIYWNSTVHPHSQSLRSFGQRLETVGALGTRMSTAVKLEDEQLRAL